MTVSVVSHVDSLLPLLSDYKNVLVCILVGGITLVACFVFKFLTSSSALADNAHNSGDGQATTTTIAKKSTKAKAKHADTSSHKKHHSKKAKEVTSDKQTKPKEDAWLATTLKGHTGDIQDMDCSNNGKLLLTCANDRAILLWNLTDITATNRKSIRINVEYDYARYICWSPDTKAFVIQRSGDDRCQVYKLVDKKATPAKDFALTAENVIAMGISATGKFMMTCSSIANCVIIWDLKGHELARIETGYKETYYACISPCGSYVATCGNPALVTIWLVDGGVVTKKLDIRGHSAAVEHIAFDQNGWRSGHIASVSQDGTIRLNRLSDKAFLVSTAKYDRIPHIKAKVAISPQGETMVVASGEKLFFYKSLLGELHHVVDQALSGSISRLLFDQLGAYLFVAGEDKHIKVYHNLTKCEVDLNDAKEKLKEQQTSATRERLQRMVKDNEQRLKDFSV